MKTHKTLITFFLCLCSQFCFTQHIIHLADYGLKPNTEANSSPLFRQAIEMIQKKYTNNEQIVLTLPQGTYHFYPQEATTAEYYISNHDQPNPKKVGIALENFNNLTFDGQNSEFIFHGQMLPISIINSSNCQLQNLSIDFDNPHISQAKIISNDTLNQTIIYEIAPWVQYEIQDSILYTKGLDWRYQPNMAIIFEEKTKHLVFNTSDTYIQTKQIFENAPRQITARNWKNIRLIPGTVIVMRSWHRPAPAIFMNENLNTSLKNIKIHYAEGMGLLAQVCENIHLDNFSVCLRGEEDPRYFTTQADATHFSGCKGLITSENGLYENMMDDAINVHGTYLKLIRKESDNSVIGRYMHHQSYGFKWGEVGDTVQFILSKTMEIIGQKNTIAAITPIDHPVNKGVKEFRITFSEKIPESINETQSIGIENLTWTPEVIFAHNTIRNNRARGSLFSTPQKTIVSHNLFDHTSGTAILLCGDCNGWFETGACRNITISNNTFVNGLTNMFQFTNAIISIYPEIPDLSSQQKYFHSGICIEDNHFETFDHPLLYAKSVNGIIFRRNTVETNNDYPAFHWNKKHFLFERVTNAEIYENTIDGNKLESKSLLTD